MDSVSRARPARLSAAECCSSKWISTVLPKACVEVILKKFSFSFLFLRLKGKVKRKL